MANTAFMIKLVARNLMAKQMAKKTQPTHTAEYTFNTVSDKVVPVSAVETAVNKLL